MIYCAATPVTTLYQAFFPSPSRAWSSIPDGKIRWLLKNFYGDFFLFFDGMHNELVNITKRASGKISSHMAELGKGSPCKRVCCKERENPGKAPFGHTSVIASAYQQKQCLTRSPTVAAAVKMIPRAIMITTTPIVRMKLERIQSRSIINALIENQCVSDAIS